MSLDIHDPLYGKFCLPSYLEGLLSCWEVQRLRYVRLLNVNSLPLATLGETSRYSHTIGVLWLGTTFLQSSAIPLDDPLAKLLLCALALHDTGTPAFGHSLEYILKEKGAGDHVDAAIAAVRGQAKLGQFYWQCAPKRTPHKGLRAKLRGLLGPAYEDMLEEALRGRGQIGHLVSSSSIDLDNVDNIFRMAHALGLRDCWNVQDPLSIAAGLCLEHQDGLVACDSRSFDSIERWLETRRRAYQVLNLHPLHLAGLAMLREAFEQYVDETGGFPPSVWWTSDAEVLEKVSLKHTRDLIQQIERGCMWTTLLRLHIDTKNDKLWVIEGLCKELKTFSYRLANALDHRVRAHAIIDRGTFERLVPLVLVDSNCQMSLGRNSRSVIISVHSRSANNYPSAEKLVTATVALLAEWFELDAHHIRDAIRSSWTVYDEFKFSESDTRQLRLW